MTSDNFVQLVQKSFRVTIGATASLVEVIQDPEKRDENLSKLNQEWSELSAQWAEKGKETEQEARNFVDTLLSQRTQTATPGTTATAPSAPPDIQLELQELTAQIIAMRAELEQIRNQGTSS